MSFPLYGNLRARESVEKFISCGRLPHAVIIEGDEGSGKRTLARFLAKAAVCESEKAPCGKCRGCHLADIGTHPDIETVAPEEKKKNIAVGQIRELRTTAYHSAHTAKRRAFIIENAETMNPASQNSLLKVLEEPPSDVLFILLVQSNSQLLETVVSRCVTVSLFPPSFEEGLECLTRDHGMDRETAEKLLRAEKNSVGKALNIYKNELNSPGRAAAHDFLDAIEKGSALNAMLSTVPLEKDRPQADRFVEELCDILAEKIRKSRRFTQTAGEYLRMYSAARELGEALVTNINLSLFFTALTSRLMAVRKN